MYLRWRGTGLVVRRTKNCRIFATIEHHHFILTKCLLKLNEHSNFSNTINLLAGKKIIKNF